MARDTYYEFWTGFGVVPAYSVLSTIPARCRAVVRVIGPLNCGTRLLFFRGTLQFVPPIPPLLGDGAGLGILATPTVAQDCVTSCFLDFGGTILPRPPRQGCGGTSVFRFSVDTFSPRPPFQLIWRWFSLTILLFLTDKASFIFLFSWRSLSNSKYRRLEVWEWVLRSRIFDSCSGSCNRLSMEFKYVYMYGSSSGLVL